MPHITKENSLYKIFLWTALVGSLILLSQMAPILVKPDYILADDYLRFWAAGRLNNLGINPYSPEQIDRMQKEAGGISSESDVISLMLNPPWTLSFVMPFGLISYFQSRLLWLLLNIAVIIYCSEKIWQLYDGPQKLKWLSWLISFTFAPTISVLEKGQITPLILLGVVGFLVCIEQRRNPWRCGIFIALISIKPQLFYLFWIALLFWIVKHRQWKILIGSIFVVILLSAIPFARNPGVFHQFWNTMTLSPYQDWAVPTIGAHLRYLLNFEANWLQYVGPAFGIIWFLYHWNKRSSRWIWSKEIPLLLLVSLTTAPYAWTYDLHLVVPAITLAFTLLLQIRLRWITIILIIIYAGINILDLILHTKLTEFWFVWLAPILLIWYLIVFQSYRKVLGTQSSQI